MEGRLQVVLRRGGGGAPRSLGTPPPPPRPPDPEPEKRSSFRNDGLWKTCDPPRPRTASSTAPGGESTTRPWPATACRR